MKLGLSVSKNDWVYLLILILLLIDKQELVKILTLVIKTQF